MDYNSAKSLKDRIRAIADKNDLKIKEVASRAGMVPAQLSEYLTTDKVPSLAVIDRIAKALNVQTWELLRPEGALPTPAPKSPTIESLTKIIAEQEARIKELEANAPKTTEVLPKELMDLFRKIHPSQYNDLKYDLQYIIDGFQKSEDKEGRPQKAASGSDND